MRRIHGGDVYSLGREVLDLSVNLNPMGPPREALEVLSRELEGLVTRYPDLECRTSTRAIARYLGLPEECVTVSNGASMAIQLCLMALRPRRVLTLEPTFTEYRLCAEALGIGSLPLPSLDRDRGLVPDPEAIWSALEEGDALFVCNPNNPTGNEVERGTLLEIAELCRRKGAHLVVDECFLELSTSGEGGSLKEEAAGGAAVVIRAMTKSFAAPGLRIGYVVSSPDLAARLRELRHPWPLNNLAEAFAQRALIGAEEYLSRARALIRANRERLILGISKAGGKPYPSDCNFVLFYFPGNVDLRGELLKRDVLIRSCADFLGLGEGHYRVAVAREEEVDLFLRALEGISVSS